MYNVVDIKLVIEYYYKECWVPNILNEILFKIDQIESNQKFVSFHWQEDLVYLWNWDDIFVTVQAFIVLQICFWNM